MQAAQRSRSPRKQRNSILSPIRCQHPNAEEESKIAAILSSPDSAAGTAHKEQDSRLCVEEDTHSCLLMTSQDRYYRYKWSIETEPDDSKKIVFRKGSSPQLAMPQTNDAAHKPIEYHLLGLQVCSIDTESEKNVCVQKRHYALNFIQKSSRKVYFVKYDNMQNLHKLILQLQGFGESRLAQYEVLEELEPVGEQGFQCTRSMVRHRITRKNYILKQSMAQNSLTLAGAPQERTIMLRCLKIKGIVNLVDSFSDDNNSYLLIESPSGETLRNAVLGLGKKYLRESEVRKCVHQLLLIVKELQRKRIKHGNISLDTVLTKRRSKGLEIRLSGFDNAQKFEAKRTSGQQIISSLSSAQRLAKKIQDGVHLQLSDDIFDIGILIFNLLTSVEDGSAFDNQSCARFSMVDSVAAFKESDVWDSVTPQCKELLAFMVHDDPRMRMSIEQVLEHPWFQFH